jgi:hypothetical protein
MTTAHDIDWPQVLADRLTTASPDVLRELFSMFIHALMGAEADALCGAGYGERSTGRTNQRNGYRRRQFDTRTGTLDLAIPKLRQGSYFPDWLLERRKRAERALTTVVATCYLLGVSTRRMDKRVNGWLLGGWQPLAALTTRTRRRRWSAPAPHHPGHPTPCCRCRRVHRAPGYAGSRRRRRAG